MTTKVALAVFAAMLCAPAAFAQSTRLEPHIGYVYPAGGRQGAKVEVIVGGQLLKGAAGAYVTGDGVRVSSVRYVGHVMNLNRDERVEISTRLAGVLERRGVEIPPIVRVLSQGGRRAAVKDTAKLPAAGQASTEEAPTAKRKGLGMPFLDNVDDISEREMAFVIDDLVRPNSKKQPNLQIADTACLEIEIDPGAAPGARELRIMTPLGLTNPMRFEVGLLSEVCEPPSYDLRAASAAPAKPPVLFNGQVKPGEVDRWRIAAQKGQRLVIDAQARALNPFLADAVPGWFQAVLTLRDADGREVAFADDYRFDPDPVLFVEVPETGVYELEIRDSIYRGRQDFVYRVSVAEGPFVTSLFPLGARAGHRSAARAEGWNLGAGSVTLDTSAAGPPIRETSLRRGAFLSNPVAYAVDDLPETAESEPNGGPPEARAIDLPIVVNGRIQTPGDEDVYSFKGAEGEEVVVEVFARRLHSPMDSLVRLLDSSGRVIAWNDDQEDKDGFLYRDMGLLTHHADSYLLAKLPVAGVYYVQVGDARRSGGREYGYRLHVRRPKPDFELCVTPSSVNVTAGSLTPVTVHALRKDGFDGGIEVALADASLGFALSGGNIPPGCNSVRVTLAAPRKSATVPVALRLEGRAMIGGRLVTRRAVPCDDMMQAFLYRHLVPAQELVVAVIGRRAWFAPPTLVTEGPIRIRPGLDSSVRVALPRRPFLGEVQMELDGAPEGLALGETTLTTAGAVLVLKADPSKAKPGLKGNLIVRMFVERESGGESGKGRKRRASIGVLPAVPFEIVEGGNAAGASS